MNEMLEDFGGANGALTTVDEGSRASLIDPSLLRPELRPNVAIDPELIARLRRRLRTGCYLIRFTPAGHYPISLVHYDGTLRFENNDGSHASGDLYQHAIFAQAALGFGTRFRTSPEPNPGAGIPTFPRSSYRYYLRVTGVQSVPFTGVNLTFERFRFQQLTSSWTSEGVFVAALQFTTAPAGFPDGTQYLSGPVCDSGNRVVGTLTMGWVSPSLRRAVIEIDRVSVSEAPLQNADGSETWATVMAKSGWLVTAAESNTAIAEKSGESWSNAELHQQLLESRDNHNLDAQWRYLVLAVRRLDATSRGIMFDNGATDSNNVPREGCAISSHWVIPEDPQWGSTAGQRFGLATDPYFRTACHEIGHAMNLIHEESEGIAGTTFMTTTPTIVNGASFGDPFPQRITWDFHPINKHRLRHWPDIYVRPGGIPFAAATGTTPIAPDLPDPIRTEEVAVEVSAVQERTPIGAPVRLEVKITNVTETIVAAPGDFRYEAGCITGYVTGPNGTPQEFRSLVRCLEESEIEFLEPGASRIASVTLMRNGSGPLFATPGAHRVQALVQWLNDGGVPIQAVGETTVWIEPATDAAHAEAAAALFAEPDAAVVVALDGGDHLESGRAAIERALASVPLRPHYAATEALRLGRAFLDRDADPDRALDLLAGEVVAGADEIAKVVDVIAHANTAKRSKAVGAAADSLRATAKFSLAEDRVTSMLDELGQ